MPITSALGKERQENKNVSQPGIHSTTPSQKWGGGAEEIDWGFP